MKAVHQLFKWNTPLSTTKPVQLMQYESLTDIIIQFITF